MNRRNALRASATLFGVPWQKVVGATPTSLPDDALFARDPETYWKRIREEQFFLPQWRSFLNNGSLGVLPRPVYRTVATYLENAAALETPYPYPRWGYETLDEWELQFADVFDQVNAFAAGAPINVVNPGSLERRRG